MHDNCDCCRGMAALIASGILDTLETADTAHAAAGAGVAAGEVGGADAGAATAAATVPADSSAATTGI